MKRIDRTLIYKCLNLMLKPVVCFCVRHSFRIQDYLECSKAAFMEVARENLQSGGVKATISRLSVMTGLHRRDVMRYERNAPEPSVGSKDLITKVVGQWQTDPHFITKAGKPRILSFGSEEAEFTKLVQSVSNDLNPATVLFELERVRAVTKTKLGVGLSVESYVPEGDPLAGFTIASNDLSDLIGAVEENIFDPQEVPNLHARTEFDNVRPEALAEIRRWFVREGHLLHGRARDFLSQYDQDVNPDPKFKGTGVHVSLGTFSKIVERKKS